MGSTPAPLCSCGPAAPAPLTAPSAPGTLGRHLRPGSPREGQAGGPTLQVRGIHLLQVPSRPLLRSLSHKGRPSHPSSQVCAGRLPTPALSPSDTCNHTGVLALPGRINCPLCDPVRDNLLPWVVAASGTIQPDSLGRGWGSLHPTPRCTDARVKPAPAEAGGQLPRQGHGASAPREPGRRWSCHDSPSRG